MRRRASATLLVLALQTGGPGLAQAAHDCAALTETLEGALGYDLTAPPAGRDGGWCVLDGAVLRSDLAGVPNISADRLRLRGEGDPLTRVEIEVVGLRVSPRLGDTTIDERLRAVFRLQSADLSLLLAYDAEAGLVRLSGGDLRLSGGTRVELEADLRADALTPAALATGSVTRRALVWRNDGRLLRPVMELLGQGITGAEGGAAVDAARAALGRVIAALPPAALAEDADKALAEAVAALPQGRGRLLLTLVAPDGIGAARLALAALSEDPTGAAALGRLFAGATITARWEPGITP